MESDEDTTITRLNSKPTRKDELPEKTNNLEVHSHAITDIGNKRDHNEDSYFTADDQGLWAVADGMGGHTAGDFASQTIVQDLSRFHIDGDLDDALEQIESLVKDAHNTLVDKATEQDPRTIIGSTLALMHVQGSNGLLLWLGDSRVYRIRSGEIEQLTTDHSLYNEMVRTGDIDPETTEQDKDTSKITRAVGFDQLIQLDHRNISILPGDRYILCSDGLTKYLSEQDIFSFAGSQVLQEANESMIGLALERGGLDNITSIILEFCEGE